MPNSKQVLKIGSIYKCLTVSGNWNSPLLVSIGEDTKSPNSLGSGDVFQLIEIKEEVGRQSSVTLDGRSYYYFLVLSGMKMGWLTVHPSLFEEIIENQPGWRQYFEEITEEKISIEERSCQSES